MWLTPARADSSPASCPPTARRARLKGLSSTHRWTRLPLPRRSSPRPPRASARGSGPARRTRRRAPNSVSSVTNWPCGQDAARAAESAQCAEWTGRRQTAFLCGASPSEGLELTTSEPAAWRRRGSAVAPKPAASRARTQAPPLGRRRRNPRTRDYSSVRPKASLNGSPCGDSGSTGSTSGSTFSRARRARVDCALMTGLSRSSNFGSRGSSILQTIATKAGGRVHHRAVISVSGLAGHPSRWSLTAGFDGSGNTPSTGTSRRKSVRNCSNARSARRPRMGAASLLHRGAGHDQAQEAQSQCGGTGHVPSEGLEGA